MILKKADIGRKKKVLINIIASALSEVVSLICSLILPRLILSHFGSDYNGIINSITQFISFVTLLRAGVGGVTRAALYRPLVENDTEKISSIVKATENYMRKIAFLFLGIMLVMASVYPIFVKDFSWIFSFSLFIILGITTFVQYYFGITYQMLLLADQRNYIYMLFNIVAVILNTILGSVFILLGFGIHFVKLASAAAFAITPILLNIYVKKHYKINKKAKPDNSALSQKRAALGHQIAYYILTSTDLSILTIFANVKYVSVYSVYFLVIKAIKTIIKTYSTSVEAAFGNVIAKKQDKVLNESVSIFECFMCLSCSFIFACALVLIVPFVQVYTKNVFDINYIRLDFAILLIVGELLYCIRIPYMSVVEASGMYEQTKIGAYIEAAVNVITSILLCKLIDPLVGVAIGTLLAMAVRTIEISGFVDRKILHRERFDFYKIIVVSAAILCATFFVTAALPFSDNCVSYTEWLIRAVADAGICAAITLIIALLAYRKTFFKVCKTIISVLTRRKKHEVQ